MSTTAYEHACERVRQARDKKKHPRTLSLRGIADLNELPPLDTIAHFVSVDLTGSHIVDLSELAKLEGLETLILDKTAVNDLDPLCNCLELKSFSAQHTVLNSLEPISGLQNLKRLDLRHASMHDYSSLNQLSDLRTLLLSGSNITDLDFVDGLSKLYLLALGSVAVANFDTLSSLLGTKILALQNTAIDDLDCIAHIKSLQSLNVARSRVHNLEPLANLKRLRELDIGNCPVKDLSPIADLTRLLLKTKRRPGGLNFAGCPIADEELQYYATLSNPRRTELTIEHLRNELGLPPVPPVDADLRIPRIPEQGIGPHFVLNAGVLELAPPSAVDEAGNNIDRIRQLYPIIREAVVELIDELSSGNAPQGRLLTQAEKYRNCLDGQLEEISFVLLFGYGLRLQNAALAAERKILDRELPELSDAQKAALDTVVELHGPLILSTSEGQELVAASERYQRSPKDEEELRLAAAELGKELAARPDIMSPESAEFVGETIEALGEEKIQEKNSVYIIGTVKNLTIILGSAGTLAVAGAIATSGGAVAAILGGALGLAVLEGTKKSKAFREIAEPIADSLDKLSDEGLLRAANLTKQQLSSLLEFVLKNEKLLRKIAGTRPELRWVHQQLDWLKQHHKSSINRNDNSTGGEDES